MAEMLAPLVFAHLPDGSVEMIAPYTRKNSRVVSTRVPLAQLAQIERAAARRRITCAALLRQAIDSLTAGASPATDPLSVLADVAGALGLSADASADDVSTALSNLLAALGPSGGDAPPPKAAKPAAAPTPGNTAPGALSRATLDAEIKKLSPVLLKKIKDAGQTPEHFVAGKAALFRRTPEKKAK